MQGTYKDGGAERSQRKRGRCTCTCGVAIALHRRDRDAYEVISSRWAQTSCRRGAFLRATLDEQRWRYALLESRGEDRDKMVRDKYSRKCAIGKFHENENDEKRQKWQSIISREV